MAQTSSKLTKTSKWENDIIEMEGHHTTETMQKNWKDYMDLAKERQVRNMELTEY